MGLKVSHPFVVVQDQHGLEGSTRVLDTIDSTDGLLERGLAVAQAGLENYLTRLMSIFAFDWRLPVEKARFRAWR